MHGTTKDSKYFLLWHLGTPTSLGAVHITLATKGKHTMYCTGLCLPWRVHDLSRGVKAGNGQ